MPRSNSKFPTIAENGTKAAKKRRKETKRWEAKKKKIWKNEKNHDVTRINQSVEFYDMRFKARKTSEYSRFKSSTK